MKKIKKHLNCIESAQLLQELLNNVKEGKANLESVDIIRKLAVDTAKLYSLNKKEQITSNTKVSKEIKDFFKIKEK